MKLMILFFVFSAFASEDHHHPAQIVLNEKALRNFGIECAAYQKESFPAGAIVRSGHKAIIYKCTGDKFSGAELNEVSPGQMVVIKGANFLKTVELSVEEGPSEGHGH